jgi:cytochrome c553
MRCTIGMIVAIGVAFPVAATATEGMPAAGKAKAEAAGCFSCHGTDGIATPIGLAADNHIPNLAGQPDLFVQFQLVYFRSGARKSPIMNGVAKPLSDEDIRNLGAYFASLPPAKPPLPPDPAPQETELGAKVAQAIHCTTCHGHYLEGVDNNPRLSGQREDYLAEALRDFKSGARNASGPAGMADVVYPLGATEMTALAHYLSRLR